MSKQWPPAQIALTPGKRVLFLTKDLELIRRQLYEGLDLRMVDLKVGDLLDDINTCLLYTSPSPRDLSTSRMPSSA